MVTVARVGQAEAGSSGVSYKGGRDPGSWVIFGFSRQLAEGAGLEVEQLEWEAAPIWDAGIEGGSLWQYPPRLTQ